MHADITRRNFVKAGAAAVATTLASSRAYGANDRIRAAFIGVGNRGGQLLEAARENADLDIVALCDVYKPYLDKQAEALGGKVDTYGDFRHILDRTDIDAVFIATPDHWHALQTVMACDAHKDVFVEKPLAITVYEGRRMVEAARRNSRVVQVGTQRRSLEIYTQLRELIQRDTVGKITVARACRLSNMYPNGIGTAPDSEPPQDLDWDMWLGPRPWRPFNENIHPYKFRWWKDYSSQIANWGVHYFDVIRWVLDEKAPVSVSAHGGKFAVNDARDIPDTMEAVFEFASGRLLSFVQYEASGAALFPKGEVELRGTLGIIHAGDRGFDILPEKGGQFQDAAPRMEPIQVKAEPGNSTAAHIRNFLDCVKSRAVPNADVEEGHLSTVFSHVANIALAMRARLDWDAETERFVDNDAANAMLHYEYRPPWKLG